MKISGWGRYPVIESNVVFPRDEDELRALVRKGDVVARGNGRAYGDCAVGHTNTANMRHFNKFLAFDEITGQFVAEAGVMLEDVINAFLPRGWFPLVTPGTRFVTLGGMIAADVHGKNHHKDGSMSSCVDWVEIMNSNGDVVRCSRDQNTELFNYTVGGMGLTGIILRAAVRLCAVETGWIRQTTKAMPNFRAAMAAFEDSSDVTYSVAWIDCLSRGSSLGRSILMTGEHAEHRELESRELEDCFSMKKKAKRVFPIELPNFVLNRFAVGAFNSLYYRKGSFSQGVSLVDWATYFYPLDSLLGWNKIYGRRGFVQFQCVLPFSESEAGLESLLTAITLAKSGSFLAVLKRLGNQAGGISFPMEGYTLALDFPASKKNFELFKELHEITIKHGGRLYLAKDAVMTPENIRESDIRVPEFISFRDQDGLKSTFSSSQSRRLSL